MYLPDAGWASYMRFMHSVSNATLRLATWNIRAGLGTDLRRDALRVINGIAALDADVVVLQEADFRLGARPSALPRDLLALHAGLVPLPVGMSAASIGWHGNTVLVKPGIRLAELELLILPGLEPRGAIIADLDGPKPLRLVAVHLGLLRSSRRRQLDAIRDAIARHPVRATVILGDFNEPSRRAGLGRLVQSFRLRKLESTYPSRFPLLALDRMAHSFDLSLRPIPIPRKRGVQASDHLPLLAELHWT